MFNKFSSSLLQTGTGVIFLIEQYCAISGVQFSKSGPVFYIYETVYIQLYTYIFFQIIFHYRLL